jgi:hypothetical protein
VIASASTAARSAAGTWAARPEDALEAFGANRHEWMRLGRVLRSIAMKHPPLLLDRQPESSISTPTIDPVTVAQDHGRRHSLRVLDRLGGVDQK